MEQGYRLSLDGPAFNGMKKDFDSLLTRTILAMQDKGVEDATITAKVDIRLTTEGNPNVNAPDSPEEQEYIAPRFKHKVTAAMQIKDEMSGVTGGKKFELVWDGKSDAFVMRPVEEDRDQTTLFDTEDDAGETDSAELVDNAIGIATAIVREEGTATTSILQRRMKIGYALAAVLLDKLEERGVVGPYQGSAPRQVLPFVMPTESTEDRDGAEDTQ